MRRPRALLAHAHCKVLTTAASNIHARGPHCLLAQQRGTQQTVWQVCTLALDEAHCQEAPVRIALGRPQQHCACPKTQPDGPQPARSNRRRARGGIRPWRCSPTAHHAGGCCMQEVLCRLPPAFAAQGVACRLTCMSLNVAGTALSSCCRAPCSLVSLSSKSK